jgi:hypothetical protein
MKARAAHNQTTERSFSIAQAGWSCQRSGCQVVDSHPTSLTTYRSIRSLLLCNPDMPVGQVKPVLFDIIEALIYIKIGINLAPL